MGVFVSVISPMYNEKDNIERFISSVVGELERTGKSWELIIVDDGSEDNSVEIAERTKGDDERIKVIKLQRHYGRGKALREGFKVAKGEYIITIESDNSWNAADIVRVLGELERGDADIVLVSPYTSGGKIKDVPLFRRIISRLGNIILGASFYGSFSMVTQMFRGYKREVIESIFLESEDKEIHLEILSKALAIGYKAREIPGNLVGRGLGKSKLRLGKTIRSHLFFSFFERPFLLFGLLGIFFFALGLILGIYFIFLWRAGRLNPDRPLMTLFIVLMVAGVQMFSFGLMGMLIVSIRREIFKIQMLARKMKEN